MRLKEPLYGVKVAGMHFLIHIILAIAMIIVQTNMDHGLVVPPTSYNCPNKMRMPEHHHQEKHHDSDVANDEGGKVVQGDGVVQLFGHKNPLNFYKAAFTSLKSKLSTKLNSMIQKPTQSQDLFSSMDQELFTNLLDENENGYDDDL